jgi:hypothetical protein
MLPNEATALSRILAAIPDAALPLLHIGSSTREYRDVQQPYVGALFRSLEDRGLVIHADVKPESGVDIVADFTTKSGSEALRVAGAKSVLCSNILEHLDMDPWEALNRVLDLVAPGGFAVITGPTVFALHPDPIDNGFRPQARDIAQRLPADFRVVEVAQVLDRRLGYYYADFGRSWARLARSLVSPRDRAVARSQWSTIARRADAFLVVAERDEAMSRKT